MDYIRQNTQNAQDGESCNTDIAGIVNERLAVERMNFSECSLSNAQERQVRIRVYNRLLREYRRRLDKSDFDNFRFAVENYLFTEQERYIK